MAGPHKSPISGLTIGHAQDKSSLTGVTVLLMPDGAVAGMDARGFATGTRQVDSLDLLHVVDRIHGLCLAGGSSFGLGASTGVLDWLSERNIGQNVYYSQIPIVPCAVVFDLGIGDHKARPEPEMAYQACDNAQETFHTGCVGAGTGIAVGKYLGIDHAMKSGIGACTITSGDLTVFCIASVNAFGCIYDPETGRPIAGARDPDNPGRIFTPERLLDMPGGRLGPVQSTVLAAVITNAKLNKVETGRVARMAQAGMARCIVPAWSPYDGDIVFTVSTGEIAADQTKTGVLAAKSVSGAIVDAVKSAETMGGLVSATEFGSV